MAATSKMPQIYVGLAALAVVGGLVYMQRKGDDKITNVAFTQGSKTAAPVIKVVPDEVDQLTIKSKDKAEVVLTKTGGAWAMTAPVAGAKIQKTAIDDVLNGLKGMTFKEAIAKGQPMYAGYDLEGDKSIHVVASKGGAPVADVWFGKQASRGQLARVGGDDQIWSVSGASSFTFDKGPKEFRDRKVWDLAREGVSGVEVHDTKGSFVFTKSATPVAAEGDAGAATDASAGEGGAAVPVWSGVHDGAPIVGLEASKIDDLINAFALGGVLNAEDFGDGKADADTGLASADATTITFKLSAGGTQKIVLGRSEGVRRYARKEGDSTIYLLAEGPSGWADSNLEKFAPPKAAGDAGVGDAASDAAGPKKK